MINNKKIQELTKILNQEPSLILCSNDEKSPDIETIRFSYNGIEGSPLETYNLYITVGMATADMNCDECKNIELSAFSHREYLGELEGDYIATIVNWFAHYPFIEDSFLEHTEIFEWDTPFAHDSLMQNIFFSLYPAGQESIL